MTSARSVLRAGRPETYLGELREQSGTWALFPFYHGWKEG